MNMEWQPIETAPKDGRDVLTFGECGVVTAMFDSRNKVWFCGFEPAIEKAGLSWNFSPTHWMPLPEPPK